MVGVLMDGGGGGGGGQLIRKTEQKHTQKLNLQNFKFRIGLFEDYISLYLFGGSESSISSSFRSLSAYCTNVRVCTSARVCKCVCVSVSVCACVHQFFSGNLCSSCV